MDVPIEQGPRNRAYRRLVIGISIGSGIAVGLGLAGLAVLGSSPWPMLILGIPLGIRVFGTMSGRLTFRDRTIGWLWPVVALGVAVPLRVVLQAWPRSASALPSHFGSRPSSWAEFSKPPWIPRAGWRSERDPENVTRSRVGGSVSGHGPATNC